MECERFGELVVKALSKLPPELQGKLENIDVVIAARPSNKQLARLWLRRYTDLL
jgi:predicted Zn-dependent protease with MMP-like domain